MRSRLILQSRSYAPTKLEEVLLAWAVQKQARGGAGKPKKGPTRLEAAPAGRGKLQEGLGNPGMSSEASSSFHFYCCGLRARTIRPDHCLGRFPVKPFQASRITETPEQLHMAKTVPKQHSYQAQTKTQTTSNKSALPVSVGL